MKVVQGDHVVGMLEVGRWHWATVRDLVHELQAFGLEIDCHESSGWFHRVFVVTGDPVAVVRVERLIGKLETTDKLGRDKARLALCAAVLALPMLAAVGAIAGDGDHVGGLTSRDRQQQQTNQTGSYDVMTGRYYYGPDIFSWEYFGNPLTNVGPGTPYSGGLSDTGGFTDYSRGSWGSGGGLGPGARGY